ncbi:MAG: peptidase [Caulobacter sp.]|nr:peptidase [Caulobacter sp.]
MFRLPIITAVAILAGWSAAAAATPAPKASYDGEELAVSAKIPVEKAQSIALKARPGTVVEKELEKEEGGSGLRYSFVIKAGEAKYEVGVDAADGAVLENAVEGDDAD